MFICARLSTWNTPIESARHKHVVNNWIVARHGAEADVPAVMLFQQGKRLADAGEHAEAEHVDFQQAERIEIVLVPFDHGAVLHGGVADGDDLR